MSKRVDSLSRVTDRQRAECTGTDIYRDHVEGVVMTYDAICHLLLNSHKHSNEKSVSERVTLTREGEQIGCAAGTLKA